MIAKYLNVDCSHHCERLLALTYLLAPERLLPIARRIEGRSRCAAAELANAIIRLDPEQAQLLARRTAALSATTCEFMGLAR